MQRLLKIATGLAMIGLACANWPSIDKAASHAAAGADGAMALAVVLAVLAGLVGGAGLTWIVSAVID